MRTTDSEKNSAPSFREALRFWTKLGFISFGGPAGQIALMHDFLVDKKKWISHRRFTDALNFCMLLPGPEAQQLATFIGWRLHGTLGGILAGILFILPSVFLLLALSIIYVHFGNLPWVYAFLHGLKPAVIALVLLSCKRIAEKSLLHPLHYLVAGGAFIGIVFFHLPFPFILAGAMLLAAIGRYGFPVFFASTQPTHSAHENLEMEKAYTHISAPPRWRRVWKPLVLGGLLWLLPLVAFALCANDFTFWKRLSLFFTQAALVTFGGAYAVLPYVAQASVEQFHWLSHAQMVDGLALGETTPGPLVMVLAFVGFMAGYHHYGQAIGMGALGLLTTTFYTFLPSFVFILLGAPLLEKSQENKTVRAVLSLVTPSIVGVILHLCLYLCQVVYFTQGFSWQGIAYGSILWTLLSLVVLYYRRVGLVTWLLLSGVYGWGLHLFSLV